MKFEYPSQLPVSTARDDIAEAVRASQVVIISGQTGSGKTTQLPKILLELGRGSHGRQIVHTQPRRLAARTVAERIASEMGVKLGEEVGYQVRFTDESSPKTRLRVVTDGILLAQIQRDPKLMQYDTIVIDEAHERSLNIDFLLGYLTALLPKRRDLKLVITSATIDSVKFQEHFEHALHTKVPVIEVSGRTYPVQIVYEPLGTAPALMRSVPGFETGAMPGDADYESLSAAPDGRMAAIHAIRTWTCPPPWHAPAPNWSSIQATTAGHATSSCSPPASATSTNSKTRCAAITDRARRTCAAPTRSRSCPCSPGSPRRSSIRCSSRTSISAS